MINDPGGAAISAEAKAVIAAHGHIIKAICKRFVEHVTGAEGFVYKRGIH